MDSHKISFICCSNDPMYEKECRTYLNHLYVPEGMQMEIKMIYGAVSMTAGYNKAMRESDAKYKVYLHQDVFLLNEHFIEDILQIFMDEQVGMIGVMANKGLPKNGIIYSSWNYGRLSTNNSEIPFEVIGKDWDGEEALTVDAVDGLLIATQYDRPWREDLFDGWDFYDVSQAIEFRKAGYLIKLPKQKKTWCFHDDGYLDLQRYDHYRNIFIREYGSYLEVDSEEQQLDYDPRLSEMTKEVKTELMRLFEQGEYESVYRFLETNYARLCKDTELSVLRILMEIWYQEECRDNKIVFLKRGMTWEEIWAWYQQHKFWLYEMAFDIGDGEKQIYEEISRNTISPEALTALVSHNILRSDKVLKRFAVFYQKIGNTQMEEVFNRMVEFVKSKENKAKKQEPDVLDDHKISFIMCCNNPQYQEECCSYLRELKIPDEYETEIIPIVGADSMTAGYNQGMKKSNARYKVYLHQDVMIWNENFIYDILKIFEGDRKIGILGVLGGVNIPDDGVLFRAWNVGTVYGCDTEHVGIIAYEQPESGHYCEVEAIDGMLIATQYDLPWREDLFTGWDFYDIAQSFEFRKQGYMVVVPYQQEPWCMHDCGRTKLQNYNAGRKILLQEYGDFFKNPEYSEKDFVYTHKEAETYLKYKQEIICLMEQGRLDEAVQYCERYNDADILDSDLSILKKLVTACDAEQTLYGGCRLWKKGETYKTILERYNQVKFLMWDAEQGRNHGKERLTELLKQDIYSMPFLIAVGFYNALYLNEMLPMFIESAKQRKNMAEVKYLQDLESRMAFGKKQGSEKEESYKTREEVDAIELACRNNASIWKKELPEYCERINHLLKEKDRNGLSVLINNQEFQDKFKCVTNMAYMILAEQIYQEEVQEGITWTVLDGHESVEAVVDFIQEIRFGLWRLEFEMGEGAGEKLLAFLLQKRVSICLLKYIVHVAGMDKVGLLGRLAELFLDHDRIAMGFAMLKYADELQPGTEEILCTMAELCLRVGKKEEALHCLNQVKWPTQITKAFRKLCES